MKYARFKASTGKIVETVAGRSAMVAGAMPTDDPDYLITRVLADTDFRIHYLNPANVMERLDRPVMNCVGAVDGDTVTITGIPDDAEVAFVDGLVTASGSYARDGLAPGAYRLRITKWPYQRFEYIVEIKAP